MAKVGEDSSDTGAEGLQAAKLWLDRSTRVQAIYTHLDRGFRDLLIFAWPHGSTTFSFDMGGQFRGDTLDGQSFMAEVKKYSKESDLPAHFRDFLAKAYVAMDSRPDVCDNFLWISWAPFQAQKWDKHCSYESVIKAIVHKENRQRVLGAETVDEATEAIDHDRASQVAGRVWLVTLSARQEDLMLMDDHYRMIVAELAAGA